MSEFRTIVHLDLDAFYCAVEEQHQPSLRGKPFAVGGRPEYRGVVSSCSYAARQLGIHSAMPMARAVKLCPDLIILPSNHKVYSQRSKQVMHILKQASPLVEQISIDEAFLDLSHKNEPAKELAFSLQQEILQKTNLSCSLGVASNKLVAKIATDVGKSSVKTTTYPQAIQIVPPGTEADFLAPLSLQMLWGIGPKTAEKLNSIGILTLGQLAQWPVKDLVNRFGKIGYDLHLRANGVGNRELTTYREPKSISQENTFSRDIGDKNKLMDQIRKQSESIANSLKQSDLLGATVKVKIRWPDFSTITRQTTLLEPTDDPQLIYNQARKIFLENWQEGQPIRLIGIGITNLQAPKIQLTMWDEVDYEKIAHLEAALYQVKSKFGENSISKGTKKLTKNALTESSHDQRPK